MICLTEDTPERMGKPGAGSGPVAVDQNSPLTGADITRMRFDKASGVDDGQGLLAIRVHDVGYFRNFGGLLGQARQVVAGDQVGAPLARAGHQLLEPDAQFFGGAVNADRAQRHLVDFLAVNLFQLAVVDENFLFGGPEFRHRRGQTAVFALEPQADVLADHAGDHQGPAHADRLAVRGAQRQGLEDVVLRAETAGKGDVRHQGPLGGQSQAELVGHGMQVDGRHAPLGHHAPGAHAGPAGGAVDGQQVDLGIRGPADGHGQLAHGVGPGFEGDALGAELADPVDFLHEIVLVEKPDPRVALELLDRPVLEGLLVVGVGGVRGDDVAPFLQLQGPRPGSRP